MGFICIYYYFSIFICVYLFVCVPMKHLVSTQYFMLNPSKAELGHLLYILSFSVSRFGRFFNNYEFKVCLPCLDYKKLFKMLIILCVYACFPGSILSIAIPM